MRFNAISKSWSPASFRSQWALSPEVTYLNHGAYGPSPRAVIAAREAWSRRLEQDPVDLFNRQLAPAVREVISQLADFLGTTPGNLALVDNATAGMNAVAASIRLRPGDEILLGSHEYGAVLRLWQHVCERTGARVVVRPLALACDNATQLCDQLFAGVTPQTRLIVASHVTSPTALVLPIEEICRRAREAKIPVCVDGPHAVAMRPLNLDQLGADFYTASCHKWLCGPFGSGFLYVHPRHHDLMRGPAVSWGRLPDLTTQHWADEFHWQGTRDPAPWLALPAAVRFMEELPLEQFREETHALAQYARGELLERCGTEPIQPDSIQWYGSMVAVPLPLGDHAELSSWLWESAKIEVPVYQWDDRWLIRVSCHAYVGADDIDQLCSALAARFRDKGY